MAPQKRSWQDHVPVLSFLGFGPASDTLEKVFPGVAVFFLPQLPALEGAQRTDLLDSFEVRKFVSKLWVTVYQSWLPRLNSPFCFQGTEYGCICCWREGGILFPPDFGLTANFLASGRRRGTKSEWISRTRTWPGSDWETANERMRLLRGCDGLGSS